MGFILIKMLKKAIGFVVVFETMLRIKGAEVKTFA